jgi:hypothetical protein
MMQTTLQHGAQNPTPAVLSLGPGYHELKHLDETLDLVQETRAEAQDLYQRTLERFATLCHQLWKQERAQGSRQGKGFRQVLQEASINVGRAYRAMKKFFPADFPARQNPPQTGTTSFAADEVELRFTGKRPSAGSNQNEAKEAKEVLECVFALTPREKDEFLSCLKVVGASQVQGLLLEAVRQAAEALRNQHAEKQEQENENDNDNDKDGKHQKNHKKNPTMIARIKAAPTPPASRIVEGVKGVKGRSAESKAANRMPSSRTIPHNPSHPP